MTPESLILLINITVIAIGYMIVFPRTAQNDLIRLLQSDLCASIAALIVSGSLFMGTDTRFSFLGMELNWFWFALLTYLLLELPFALWYLKKQGVL